MMYPASGRARSVDAAEVAKRRSASELSLIGSVAHPVAEAADSLDHVAGNFLAQAADENLDRVGIPIEILVIEMLDQFGARHDATIVMHQIGEQPEFVGSKLHRLALAGDPRRLRVEP